ncbi:MAG: hypothetical protein JSS48_08535 [Nitrospira sp.]|nr:hypothetical protein [Nitrospira sp.]
MSSANLNPNPVPVEPKTRFDLKKHVHEERPFFSGVRMFVSVVFSAAALAVAVAGGGYLLLTGPPSDFYQKPVEIKPDASKPNLTPAQEKSLQEKVAGLFEDYRQGWNSGSFPEKLTLSGFTSRDMDGKVSSSTTDFYDGKQTIGELRVTNIAQVSADEISVTVSELTRYNTGIKNWYINAGGTDQQGDLVIEKIVDNEYRLVNSGGWKIKSREWKRQTGSIIQQVGDDSPFLKLAEGEIAYDDRRPSKETLTPVYQTIATGLQTGTIAYLYFPSSYKITFGTGGSIDRNEFQGRLNKVLANVRDLEITANIESVEQTGSKSAKATVRYSARFTVFDYDKYGAEQKSRNTYIAVWKDEDVWTRQTDTDTVWQRQSTVRLERSPLWQHYEAKTPPKPPFTGSTATSTSRYYDTPPSTPTTGSTSGG